MRVGVLGLRRGRALLRVLAGRDDVTVAAVCDTDAGRLHDVGDTFEVSRRYRDFESFLDAGLDAVVLATPAPVHAGQAIAALDAGMHVLSEVPAAWSLEECHALHAAALRSSGVYMLAENVCYFHYVREWKGRVASGEIGEVFYAEAEYVHDCRHLMTGGTWRARLPPIHYCTHSLGPLLDILDDRCVSVVGMGTGCHTSPETGATDIEVALFRTAKGRVLKVLCGFSVCREPAMHWQVLYGTAGSLENRRAPGDSAKIYRAGDASLSPIDVAIEDPDAPEGARVGGHGTSEYYMVDDFLRAAREGTPPPIDIEFGLAMTAPGICAHLSAERDGRPVDIPRFTPPAPK